MRDILAELQKIFRDVFDDDSLEIDASTCAEDIEDWDSLAQMALLVASEKRFQVRFSVSDIVDLKNVGDMMKLVEKKLQPAEKADV